MTSISSTDSWDSVDENEDEDIPHIVNVDENLTVNVMTALVFMNMIKDKEIMITIYTQPYCRYCVKEKSYLNPEQPPPFTAILK